MNTYPKDEYLGSFCIPSMNSNMYNFLDEYGWMRIALQLAHGSFSIYTMITETMYFSFNWIHIGSHTNLECMDSDLYSMPFHPSNFVFHIASNDCHPWVHFSQKLFIFSFSTFTNVSLTLPKSIPVTFFTSMTKQLSFYHRALVCCTFFLFIGNAPTNLSLKGNAPTWSEFNEPNMCC